MSRPRKRLYLAVHHARQIGVGLIPVKALRRESATDALEIQDVRGFPALLDASQEVTEALRLFGAHSQLDDSLRDRGSACLCH